MVGWCRIVKRFRIYNFDWDKCRSFCNSPSLRRYLEQAHKRLKIKMLPYIHFISAVLGSIFLLLLKWQWWQISLFFLTAFFIDMDHYIYFIHKKKSLSLIRAYKYFLNLNKTLKKKIHLLFFFHTIEFFILLVILTIISFNIFFPLLLGFAIHYVLDLTARFMEKNQRYHRGFSIIYHLLKR